MIDKFTRVFKFGADRFGSPVVVSVPAYSVGDAFARAVDCCPGCRLQSIDDEPVDRLTAYAAAHYVADVRPVAGRLRVACPATTVDGFACSAVETIDATPAALRAWLGY